MEYYTLKEAAEYFSAKVSEEINEMELLDIVATTADIRLLAKLNDCYVAKIYTNDKGRDVEIKRFSGIIKVFMYGSELDGDDKLILSHGIVQEVSDNDDLGKIVFPCVDNVESKDDYVISQLKDQEIYKDRFIVMTCNDAKNLEYSDFVIPFNDLMISKKDLDDYINDQNI